MPTMCRILNIELNTEEFPERARAPEILFQYRSSFSSFSLRRDRRCS